MSKQTLNGLSYSIPAHEPGQNDFIIQVHGKHEPTGIYVNGIFYSSSQYRIILNKYPIMTTIKSAPENRVHYSLKRAQEKIESELSKFEEHCKNSYPNGYNVNNNTPNHITTSREQSEEGSSDSAGPNPEPSYTTKRNNSIFTNTNFS